MRPNTWNLSEEMDVIFVLMGISGGGGGVEALPPRVLCASLTASVIPVV